MTPSHREKSKRRLWREEGEKKLANGNHALYQDSVGVWTIGHGYAIGIHGLPSDVVGQLDAVAYDAAETGAEGIPGYSAADPIRQGVVVRMVYQLGLGGVLDFKRFVTAFAHRDYNTAAAEMLDSEWYHNRHGRGTPARAAREAAIMLSGID